MDLPLVPVDQYSPGVNDFPPFTFPHVENPADAAAATNGPKEGEGSLESSESQSSALTSSDKLSALPPPATPHRPRYRSYDNASSPRLARRSLDGSPPARRDFSEESSPRSTPLQQFYMSNSLPALESSFPSLINLNSNFTAASQSHPNQLNRAPGTPARASVSEGSLPRQRVSFDSDRGSIPTMGGVRQAFSRLTRHSDPEVASPILRRHLDSPMPSRGPSPSNSRPGSRTGSPLRIFQQWSSGLYRAYSREDPFVAVDPFQRRTSGGRPPAGPAEPTYRQMCEHGHSCGLPLPCASCYRLKTHILAVCGSVKYHSIHTVPFFLWHTLPCETYLMILLQLPTWYFSRVARVFEDAEVSKPDIQRMIEATGVGEGPTRFGNVAASSAQAHNLSPLHGRASVVSEGGGHHTHGPSVLLPYPDDWTTTAPSLARFKRSWEQFIDSLVREWKQLNIISALLLASIIALFQIESIDDDPLTRTAAFLALICSLMSLCYGCVYIVRFGNMRSMWRASKWAEEARKTDASIWWNVFILLAMPAIWLAWSMIFFILSILSFLWTTGTDAEPPTKLTSRLALGPRIAVTALLALGIFYFVLIVHTLKQYGSRASPGAGGVLGRLESGSGAVAGESERQRGRATERVYNNNPPKRSRGTGRTATPTVGLGLTGTGIGTPVVPDVVGLEVPEPEKRDKETVDVEVKEVKETTG